ncbi:hypothetical protein OFN39_35830, partial [Escherichia coli]|nr:hypothetical protein [Escherichia coli]
MDRIEAPSRSAAEAARADTRWWLSDRARLEAERRTIGHGAQERAILASPPGRSGPAAANPVVS